MKVSIAWILFALALLVIIGQQMCNRPAPAGSMVPRNQFEALQRRLEDTSASYQRFRLWSDSALNNSTATALQANERADNSKAALDRALIMNNNLLSKLDSAAKEKPDSSWIQVSPRYRDGCDSLRRNNLTLNYRIMQFEQDAQNQANSLAYETHLRDSILERERDFNAQFQHIGDTAIKTGKQEEKLLPGKKVQLYGGIAAWGNRTNLLGGGEINLSLKTPNDAIYELKGAYLNTWWVGIGTKFKFHF